MHGGSSPASALGTELRALAEPDHDEPVPVLVGDGEVAELGPGFAAADESVDDAVAGVAGRLILEQADGDGVGPGGVAGLCRRLYQHGSATLAAWARLLTRSGARDDYDWPTAPPKPLETY